MVTSIHGNWKQTNMRDLSKVLACAAFCIAAAACTDNHRQSGLNAAENFIDAFYSFDAERLAAALDAGEDEARMLYYQGWAEAANYRIKQRRPCTWEDDQVVCRITVTDDFGGTLGYVATDTFTLTLEGAAIVGAASQGDDPPIFMALFAWIGEQRPEVMAGPCKDMFAGGTTPADCARAVVDSARVFIDVRAGNPDQHDE